MYVQPSMRIAAICLTAIVCSGCELFPPTPPPPVGGATKFTEATGGILGAAQGHIVALRPELLDAPDLQAKALEVSRAAETGRQRLGDGAGPSPTTAPIHPDLNADGFLTLDEVITLARTASDPNAVARAIRDSGYLLIASRPQLEYLRALGVPDAVLTAFPATPEPKPRRWPLID